MERGLALYKPNEFTNQMMTISKHISSIQNIPKSNIYSIPKWNDWKRKQKNVNEKIFKRNRSQLHETYKQMIHFPKGVEQLYNDCLTYSYIDNASKTKRNAWTRNKKVMQDELKERWKQWSTQYWIENQNEDLGLIPRRQKEHQRQVEKDLLSCAPIVMLSIIPIVGNFFTLVGIAYPRLLLSRQFTNKEQKRIFYDLEYKQKERNYINLSKLCMKTTNWINIDIMISLMNQNDVAGPFTFQLDPILREWNKSYGSIERLSRTHLIQLSLTSGIFRFSESINVYLCHMLPSKWLIHYLQKKAKDILYDDALLIQEQYDPKNCHSLTDDEILSACHLRGIPTDASISIKDMRTSLSNYLIMMKYIDDMKEQSLSLPSLELFVLHFQPLRYYMKNE